MAEKSPALRIIRIMRAHVQLAYAAGQRHGQAIMQARMLRAVSNVRVGLPNDSKQAPADGDNNG